MTGVRWSLRHQRILIRPVWWCDRGWAMVGGQLPVFLMAFQSWFSNHSWESVSDPKSSQSIPFLPQRRLLLLETKFVTQASMLCLH